LRIGETGPIVQRGLNYDSYRFSSDRTSAVSLSRRTSNQERRRFGWYSGSNSQATTAIGAQAWHAVTHAMDRMNAGLAQVMTASRALPSRQPDQDSDHPDH